VLEVKIWWLNGGRKGILDVSSVCSRGFVKFAEKCHRVTTAIFFVFEKCAICNYTTLQGCQTGWSEYARSFGQNGPVVVRELAAVVSVVSRDHWTWPRPYLGPKTAMSVISE
jgi:hypothetical protein